MAIEEVSLQSTLGWGTSTWDLTITPCFDLYAGSDVVSFNVSTTLGLQIEQKGDVSNKVKEIYGLSYWSLG